jgi:hypothetical protein
MSFEETKAPTEDLVIELSELRLHVTEPYLTEKRKADIQRRIAYLSFELSERAKE